MSLTAAEHLKARQMHAGDRSYANIGIALGKPADEVRDALTPGWRESGSLYARHEKAKRAAEQQAATHSQNEV